MSIYNVQSVGKPKGLFDGENFMTPNVLAYYKLRHGYAELSEGEGMSRQKIYGVTIQPDTEKRSKMFHSKAAAMEYIELLTE